MVRKSRKKGVCGRGAGEEKEGVGGRSGRGERVGKETEKKGEGGEKEVWE